MKLSFKQLTTADLKIVFSWLDQDFIKAFWDNSQEHKDDILNFVEGRKTPSPYASGKYVYWLAFFKDEPFAMIMIIRETPQDDIDTMKIQNLSKTGNTYSLDYMIGNERFVGKGYGANTLSAFVDFFCQKVDPRADTFLIDPEASNTRAKHVYLKAGFNHVGDFIMEGDCSGKGKVHHLLVRKI